MARHLYSGPGSPTRGFRYPQKGETAVRSFPYVAAPWCERGLRLTAPRRDHCLAETDRSCPELTEMKMRKARIVLALLLILLAVIGGIFAARGLLTGGAIAARSSDRRQDQEPLVDGRRC